MIASTRSHKVVSMKEEDELQTLVMARPVNCDVHTNKELELFCYDCNRAICMLCKLTRNHAPHNCSVIEEVSADFKKQLECGAAKLKCCQRDISEELQAVDVDKNKFLNQLTKCEVKIKERSRVLKRLVELQEEDLMKKLENMKEERLKTFATRREEVAVQQTVIDSFKQYMEEITTKGSACAVVSSATEMLAGVDEIRKKKKEVVDEGKLKEMFASFVESDIQDIQSFSRNLY